MRPYTSHPSGITGAVALVIDDSPVLRRTIVALLETSRMFSQVLSEEDGLAGFSTMRRTHVDIVLCDMNMPNCNGMRFLQLKAADPALADVPVVMLTSDEDVNTKVRSLVLGAHDYVSKGAPAAEVRARISVHLKLKRARDELNAQREELQRLTRTDSLTGLANRRWMDECLDQELSRCARYARPMSLIMIDLDHFKKLNDRYGHQAGDQMLKHTADIVRKTIRRQDVAARYGGEELSVIMPETPLERGEVAAERLRLAIEESELEWRGRTLKATASLGVAGVPALVAADAADLLRLADKALYRAKAGGRNRVVAATLEDSRRGNSGPLDGRPDSGPIDGRPDSGPLAERKDSGPLDRSEDAGK